MHPKQVTEFGLHYITQTWFICTSKTLVTLSWQQKSHDKKLGNDKFQKKVFYCECK